jgi:hypothetical protein
MKKKEILRDKISELALKHWKDNKKPLLLSQLGPKLTENDIEYKTIIYPKGIARFISEEVKEVVIIKHPSQFAKVGIHPKGETFSYDNNNSADAEEVSDIERIRKSRRAFYGFIDAISDFPKEELSEISIPTTVIVRLLQGK